MLKCRSFIPVCWFLQFIVFSQIVSITLLHSVAITRLLFMELTFLGIWRHLSNFVGIRCWADSASSYPELQYLFCHTILLRSTVQVIRGLSDRWCIVKQLPASGWPANPHLKAGSGTWTYAPVDLNQIVTSCEHLDSRKFRDWKTKNLCNLLGQRGRVYWKVLVACQEGNQVLRMLCCKGFSHYCCCISLAVHLRLRIRERMVHEQQMLSHMQHVPLVSHKVIPRVWNGHWWYSMNTHWKQHFCAGGLRESIKESNYLNVRRFVWSTTLWIADV